MRVAFYALLLMNLAYFAWAHWVDAPRAAPVNEAIAHLPQLKLVDELPAAERPQPPRSAQKTSLNSGATCVSVGPFADLASSSQGVAILRARGLEPRQRAEQSPAAESYWVYVAGLPQSEADRALVALEHSGIQDARVTPDNGGTTRRLSLGVYSERARAERRAEAVRQAGLQAEIAARRTTGSVYFLDLTPSGGVDAIPLQELTAHAVTSRIALQPCPPDKPTGAAGLD